jgi:hypothetical protein
MAEREDVISFDAIINAVENDGIYEKVRHYTHRLSVDLASAPQGHAFVNGKHFDLNDVSESFVYDSCTDNLLRNSFVICRWRLVNNCNTCKNRYGLVYHKRGKFIHAYKMSHM